MSLYPGAPNEQLTPPQLAAIDKAAGWPQQFIGQAVLVEENESGGNTAAWNPNDPDGGSIGNFQINGVHAPGGELTSQYANEMANPLNNARYALSLFEGQGDQWAPAWNADVPSVAAGVPAADVAAASSVSAATPAQLDSIVGDLGNWAKDGLNFATNPLGAAAGAAGSLATGVASSATKSIESVAIKVVGALAGAALVILGLYRAASPDSHPVKAAESAGAMAAVAA